jgi:hypothetical protein
MRQACQWCPIERKVYCRNMSLVWSLMFKSTTNWRATTNGNPFWEFQQGEGTRSRHSLSMVETILIWVVGSEPKSLEEKPEVCPFVSTLGSCRHMETNERNHVSRQFRQSPVRIKTLNNPKWRECPAKQFFYGSALCSSAAKAAEAKRLTW